jgi:hypothetical protein
MQTCLSKPDIEKTLRSIIDYNIDKNFEGYDKFDGINNMFNRGLLKNNRLLGFFFQQLVKESPVNLRKILGVKRSQNIKGNALFISALVRMADYFQESSHLDAAIQLAEQQVSLASADFDTLAWGHNFNWEGVSYTLPAFYPNITNTIFSGKAFLTLYAATNDPQHFKVAVSAKDSILNIFAKLHESSGSLALSYFSFESRPIVINIQATAAEFLFMINKQLNDDTVDAFAKRLLNFVLESKNENHSWYYHHPRKNYWVKKDHPDNYHTAFILDSLLTAYESTDRKDVFETYQLGLDYYKKVLFTAEGAPRWNEKHTWPADIHGAASAIIALANSSKVHGSKEDKAFVDRVLEWTFKKMYNQRKQYFVYRKSKFFAYNYRLNRWSDAWMSLALITYLENA